MKISMRGFEPVIQMLKDLPRGAKIAMMRSAAAYLVGDSRHGLKHNPNRVQHGSNNPYKWQSDKQRKAYFASDGFGGGIPYQRTGDLSEGWTYTETNSDWRTVKIENNVDYAGYVQGDELQRGHKADGWRYYLDVINTNINGAIQAAQRAVDALISKVRNR